MAPAPAARGLRTDLNEFEHRLRHAEHTLNLRVPAGHRRGTFLDIGCGCGNAVLAASKLGFHSAVGVDNDLRRFPWFSAREFPALCSHYGARPANARLIEADIFDVALVPASFDVVTMLDSIEHVPTPEKFIARAAELLAPDGLFVLDCGQLYYAIAGHHLFSWFGRENFPWAHLRKDFADLIAARKIDDWSLNECRTLNKVTHDEIRNAILANGLEIVQERRGAPSADDLELLEKNRPFLDLTGIKESWLFEDWILIVARKP